jgi:hypothetical protein
MRGDFRKLSTSLPLLPTALGIRLPLLLVASVLSTTYIAIAAAARMAYGGIPWSKNSSSSMVLVFTVQSSVNKRRFVGKSGSISTVSPEC